MCVGCVYVKEENEKVSREAHIPASERVPHVHVHTPRIAASEQASPKGRSRSAEEQGARDYYNLGPIGPSGDTATGAARKLFQSTYKKETTWGKLKERKAIAK